MVVGAFGCISKDFSGWMDTLGIKLNVGMVQIPVLLGTTRILRKVLDIYKVKTPFWPLATRCSSPKRNISALRTASVKAIKRHNNNINNIIMVLV